ncbi:MAG TPA: hypothetical protein VMM78_02765 [Thermomicrobiales bacterium]|nr:hypothetical protein [Thermomicrobiales bacterium]
MICPQCGKRNELGAQRCRYCQRPFTRAATPPRAPSGPEAWHQALEAARQGFDPRPPERRRPSARDEQAAWEPDEPRPMPRAAASPPAARAARPRRRGSSRSGCLLAFGIASILLVGGLLALLLAATMIVQPMIRDAAVAEIGGGVRDEVTRQIDTQIGDALSGDVVISEDDINEQLAGNVDLGPITDVTVQITPEGLIVRLRAYGVDGSYRAQVLDQDGSVVITGSPMEGPLAYMLSDRDLEEAVNDALAAAISDAGYYVEQVAVAEGAITLTLAQ